MTIKTQKVIKYIPIVQLLTVFCWLRYYSINYLKWSDFAKALFKMMGVFLLINIPRIIVNRIFNNDILDNILYIIAIYPSFFAVASIVVADQEKHEVNKKRT